MSLINLFNMMDMCENMDSSMDSGTGTGTDTTNSDNLNMSSIQIELSEELKKNKD